jgi:hypothetical protein
VPGGDVSVPAAHCGLPPTTFAATLLVEFGMRDAWEGSGVGKVKVFMDEHIFGASLPAGGRGNYRGGLGYVAQGVNVRGQIGRSAFPGIRIDLACGY